MSETAAYMLMQLAADAELMAQLRAVRALAPPDACIAAGAVRNRVWDLRFPGPAPVPPADVDVVFHDVQDIRPERDAELQQKLAAACPGPRWEVVNQARVHQWQPGLPAWPSLEAAMSAWPETATAVGLRLDGRDVLSWVAPHGVDDLLMGVLRKTAPTSAATYAERLARKGFALRWPALRVISE